MGGRLRLPSFFIAIDTYKGEISFLQLRTPVADLKCLSAAGGI